MAPPRTSAGTYTDGSTADLTGTAQWSSTAAAVATIGTGGLAAAVAQGSATISAAVGAITGSAALTVTPPLTPVTWTGPAIGSWHEAGNWSTGQVPGPFNDVVIDAAAGTVVTYSQGSSSVHSLTSHNDLTLSGGQLALGAASEIGGTFTLSGGGELDVSDDILVSGPFTVAGGILGGPGKVTAAGGLVISGSEQLLITGCTLENTGTATWSSGNVVLGAGGAIVNTPGALFDIQFDGFLTGQAGTSSPPFSNAGTLRKSAGVNTAYLASVTLYNSGAVDLRSGTLTLEPRPVSPGVWTGSFTGAAVTTLVFAGPHDLRLGSSLSGHRHRHLGKRDDQP